MSSRSWPATVRDVKTACLQGRPTTRAQKLACSLFRDETPTGFHEEQLLLLLTEVYGLVSGPSWWRVSLLRDLISLGYKLNPYDKCILTLPATELKKDETKDLLTEGIVVIEVDDLLEGGNARHQRLMDSLSKKILFGKAVRLLGTPEGTMYAGRSLRQLPNFGFTIHMEQYIYKRLTPVALKRRVLVKNAPDTKLDPEEQSQLRGVLASLNWLAREGRPDVAAAASILSGAFPDPVMSDLHEANEVVRHLKTTPVEIRIHAIKEEDLRLLLVTDAAFDTSGKEKSQRGWILAVTNPSMNQGTDAVEVKAFETESSINHAV